MKELIRLNAYFVLDDLKYKNYHPVLNVKILLVFGRIPFVSENVFENAHKRPITYFT